MSTTELLIKESGIRPCPHSRAAGNYREGTRLSGVTSVAARIGPGTHRLAVDAHCHYRGDLRHGAAGPRRKLRGKTSGHDSVAAARRTTTCPRPP